MNNRWIQVEHDVMRERYFVVFAEGCPYAQGYLGFSTPPEEPPEGPGALAWLASRVFNRLAHDMKDFDYASDGFRSLAGARFVAEQVQLALDAWVCKVHWEMQHAAVRVNQLPSSGGSE